MSTKWLYFINLVIVFLTRQRDVLLHTSFGGVLFQVLSLKKFAKTSPTSNPTLSLRALGPFSVSLHSCRNNVLGAASVPSVLWRNCQMPRRIVCDVELFWFLNPLQGQSYLLSVGATIRNCITATYETRKIDGCV